MQCAQFRQLADSYLNNELIVETNHQIISHLEHCAECRRELAARRELGTTLRHAFTNAPENQMRPEFADRLRKDLHDYALGKQRESGNSPDRSQLFKRKPRIFWVAIAACLILAAGLGLALFRRLTIPTHPGTPQTASTRPTTNNSTQRVPGTSVNLDKAELARSAVGDHRDCAIQFRLAEKPIDLEVAGRRYDPVYTDLTKAVLSQGNTPLNLELIEAHSCVFESRRFAHLVLKYHGRVVSFLVTDAKRTTDGTEGTAPGLSQSQVIACSQFDGYQVSCFQAGHHAVFVVSDMTEGENLALARALAPSVFAHITRIESAV